MIKRIFMTVVLLGGMFGVSSFANTIIVGVENTTDTILDNTAGGTEANGDFNDLIVQLTTALPGLQVVSTTGTWLPFSSSIVNQSGPSTTNPFWDNVSIDNSGNPAGTPKNIGYCLTTTNCSLNQTPAAVTQYYTTSGNAGLAPNFYFTFSGAVQAISLGGIGNTVGNTNESLGIMDLGAHAGTIQWIVTDGVAVSSVTPLDSSFELIFSYGAGDPSKTGTFFYSNQLGSFYGGNPATVPYNRFALFQYPDPSGVPEPGTMALFGIGALALGLIPRLRRRS